MNKHIGAPRYKHDCTRCRFLGHTIGGMRIHDLYVCDTLGPDRSPTVIARYGNDGPEYLSTNVNWANADGHSELFVAAYLWRMLEDE